MSKCFRNWFIFTCDERWVFCGSVESPYHTPEAKITLYVN